MKVYLNEPGTLRIRRGHPWIYSNQISRWEGQIMPGDLVEVMSAAQELLGYAYANPEAVIAARMLYSLEAGRRGGGMPNEHEEIHRKLDRARSRRANLELDSNAYRLVWSEADGLPGVICDVYDDAVVLQLLTAGADRRRDDVADWLASRLKPRGIYERSEGAGRSLEGRAPRRGWIWQRPGLEEQPAETVIHEGPMHFRVDFNAGHKTGFYLDQRAARRLLRRQSLSGRALDAFSYSGGFSLAAGFAGAESVVAVDASQEALGQLAANAELNGFQDRIMTVRENVFVYLKAAVNRKEKFSTVILDPPSFTRSAGEREDALRGYRELHRRAAQLLLPGGLLLSCSCSHHVSREEFRKIALSGVDNTGHRLEIISLFGPDGDHPEVSQVPESRYLTCLLGKLK